ncbi:hypothetical protein SAMN05892883_1797 [Jatrophihabitans sp. GAS493]|uniref:hypothetical protein n=1 Tax=Jatrophihabitans sp. GAS493 TaxID=1907575 RepID=UPI000BB94BA8|nr:hypothetical protein [Jatrophihabitans sp. GAS493]SOD72400.1 hypothetical protein SAMN05892883_1797 [Jatrophihabitans sp. GAS493]
MSNPLIDAGPDSAADQGLTNLDSWTAGTAGAGIFYDAASTVKDFQNGNWVAQGVDLAGDGLDLLGIIADPLGALGAAGIGWLIEHIGFLMDALDLVGGNPDEVSAKSQTWQRIAAALEKSSSDYTRSAEALGSQYTGPAAAAYQRAAANYASTISGAADHARNAAQAMTVAGVAVGTVRGIIRDSIAQFVSDAIWKFVAAQALAIETLGGSEAAFVIDEVAEGSSLAMRNASRIMKLVNALKQLETGGRASGKALSGAAQDLKSAAGASRGATRAADTAARDAHRTTIASTSRHGAGDVDKYKDAVAGQAAAKSANRGAADAAQTQLDLALSEQASARHALATATTDADREVASTRLADADSEVNKSRNNLDHLAKQSRNIDTDTGRVAAGSQAAVDRALEDRRDAARDAVGQLPSLGTGDHDYLGNAADRLQDLREVRVGRAGGTDLKIDPVNALRDAGMEGTRAPSEYTEQDEAARETAEGVPDGGLIEGAE